MTVTSEAGREAIGVASGSGRDWAFGFRYYSEAHIRVAVLEPDGTAWEEKDDALWTLTPGPGNAQDGWVGGTITYPKLPTSPLAAGWKVRVSLSIPYTQANIDLTQASGFDPRAVEREFDLIVLRDQQLRDAVDRAVTYPEGVESGDLPDPEAGRYIGWNDDGTALENKGDPEGRVLRLPLGAEVEAEIETPAAGRVLMMNEAGTQFIGGPLATDIEEAQDASEAVLDALADIGLPYPVAADLEAATVPAPVEYVVLSGHLTPGDGGGAEYIRVGSEPAHAGKVQSADGAWWEIARGGPFYSAQFGASPTGTASENVAALQAFFDYLTTVAPSDPWGVVEGVINGDYTINQSLDIGAVGTGEGVHIHFQGKLIAASDFTINDPMLIVTADHTELHAPTLDCGKRAAGIDVDGGGIKIHHPNIWNFQDYGILLDGSFGDTNVYHPVIAQWNRSDTEFATDANFTADAIRFDRADCNLYGGVTKWSGCCLRFTANSNTVNVYDHHPFNGRPVGDAGGPRVDPKLLVQAAGGNATLFNCYLDNGQVDMYGPGLRLQNCFFLINSAAVDFTDDRVIGIFANGQTSPYQTFISDLFTSSSAVTPGGGGWALVKFLSEGANSWSGDYTQINADLADIAWDRVTARQPRYNVIAQSDDVPSETWAKPVGEVRLHLLSGTALGAFGWNGTAFRLNVPGVATPLRLGGATNGFTEDSGTITVITGNNAKTFDFVSSGVFRPGEDGTQNLGGAANRWGTVFAATGAINTSDEREKASIDAIPDTWLDAWGDVEWCRYRFSAAMATKMDGARWHIGLVAQRVRDAFLSREIDPFGIGLLCYDEWEGGNAYGLRYDEALAMEAAWTRRELSRLATLIAKG